MILVEKILGNLKDADWHKRSHDATVDYLALEQWEAPKNRFEQDLVRDRCQAKA